MGRAIVISQMDPPPGDDQEFDSWQEREDVPLRMRVPGFRSAVRAQAVQGLPSRLVVHYLSSLRVLESPEYLEIEGNPSPRTAQMLQSAAAYTRYVGDEISDTGDAEPGRFFFLFTFSVPEDFEDELDAWYECEHVPLLMKNESWMRCRRYRIVDAEPAGVTRATVHEFADLSALDSPETARARATPWRARLAKNNWFSSARYAIYEHLQTFSGE